MARRIVFNGEQLVNVEEYTPTETLNPNQVRVAGICSLMSTGTENIVLNRLFDPGTHWDQWVKYPFYPGYSYLGEVTELGADVTRLSLGQRVVLRAGHATEQIVDADRCLPVPEAVDNQHAVWFALAKIAYTGAHAAAHTLGDKVLVVGGGPIGQLSARWALAAGAKVGLVDRAAARLSIAQQAGPLHLFTGLLDEVADDIQTAFGAKPSIVIDTTGVASVFQQALALCGNHGKVVLLGDTGSPENQHLTSDVLGRGIHIIGTHDSHHPDKAPTQLLWELIADGRINLRNMNTHQFSIDQAEEAYQLANRDRENTLGIIFHYR